MTINISNRAELVDYLVDIDTSIDGFTDKRAEVQAKLSLIVADAISNKGPLESKAYTTTTNSLTFLDAILAELQTRKSNTRREVWLFDLKEAIKEVKTADMAVRDAKAYASKLVVDKQTYYKARPQDQLEERKAKLVNFDAKIAKAWSTSGTLARAAQAKARDLEDLRKDYDVEAEKSGWPLQPLRVQGYHRDTGRVEIRRETKPLPVASNGNVGNWALAPTSLD